MLTTAVMQESEKNEIAGLIIGTFHEYQRHQDAMPDRERIRAEFERLLRGIIHTRHVSLICEEAGNDTEVWEQLKHDEEMTPPEFAALFSGTEVGDRPQSTIAKQIASERGSELTHVDIRPQDAEAMQIEERSEAMATKIIEVLGAARSVLVVCGEIHRTGVEQQLKKRGVYAESICFPEARCHPHG